MDWGSTVPGKQWRGIWGKTKFYGALEDTSKTGRDWLGGPGFSCRVAGSIFQGKGS